MAARKERVTRVIDGDTFETAVRKRPVRLANVDAPEKGEPGASAATNLLKKLIKDKKVNVETVARDKYRRAVAKVKVDGRSVNAAIRKKVKKK